MCELSYVTVLLASLVSTAKAGPTENALQVVEKWTKAFTKSDVEGILKLHSLDALFLGTSQ